VLLWRWINDSLQQPGNVATPSLSGAEHGTTCTSFPPQNVPYSHSFFLLGSAKEGVKRTPGKSISSFGKTSIVATKLPDGTKMSQGKLVAPKLLQKQHKQQAQQAADGVAKFVQNFRNNSEENGAPERITHRTSISSSAYSQLPRKSTEEGSRSQTYPQGGASAHDRQTKPSTLTTTFAHTSTHVHMRNAGPNGTRQMQAVNAKISPGVGSKYGQLSFEPSPSPSAMVQHLNNQKILNSPTRPEPKPPSRGGLGTGRHRRDSPAAPPAASNVAPRPTPVQNRFSQKRPFIKPPHGLRTAMGNAPGAFSAGRTQSPLSNLPNVSRANPKARDKPISEPIDLTMDSDEDDEKPRNARKTKGKQELNAPTRQDVLDLTGSESTGVDVADVDKGEMLDPSIFKQDKSNVKNNPKLCRFLQLIMVGTNQDVLDIVNYDDEEDENEDDLDVEEVSADKIMGSVHAPGLGSYALTAADLKCLTQREWLNDEIINAYLCLLTHRNNVFQKALAEAKAKSEEEMDADARAKTEEEDTNQVEQDAGVRTRSRKGQDTEAQNQAKDSSSRPKQMDADDDIESSTVAEIQDQLSGELTPLSKKSKTEHEGECVSDENMDEDAAESEHEADDWDKERDAAQRGYVTKDNEEHEDMSDSILVESQASSLSSEEVHSEDKDQESKKRSSEGNKKCDTIPASERKRALRGAFDAGPSFCPASTKSTSTRKSTAENTESMDSGEESEHTGDAARSGSGKRCEKDVGRDKDVHTGSCDERESDDEIVGTSSKVLEYSDEEQSAAPARQTRSGRGTKRKADDEVICLSNTQEDSEDVQIIDDDGEDVEEVHAQPSTFTEEKRTRPK
jgi:hypothetical protein